MKGQRWTRVQDQLLFDFGPVTGNRELSAMTGKSIAAVVYRLGYFGIRKQARAKSKIYSDARSRQWQKIREAA